MDAAKVMTFQCRETRIFDVPKETIYGALHDMRRWPEHLPHVLRIEVLYDDGQYQEFRMTVASDPETIQVRSIRNCRADTIDFFQPEPPVFLRHHAGQWEFTELPGGRCQVVVTHAWNLEPERAAAVFPPKDGMSTEQQVEDMLAGHSRQTLDAWQNALTAVAR